MGQIIPFSQLVDVPTGSDSVSANLRMLHGILNGAANVLDANAASRKDGNLQAGHLALADAFTRCRVSMIATPTALRTDNRDLVPPVT